MESHDLRIFKHVAQLQSMSKTAEKLGYVQPNISQRMKGLEDELGVKLFIRNNRGVTLTNEGKILLNYVNQMTVLMEEAKAAINPHKWREPLTIGASQTISAVKIPQLVSAFLKTNHTVDVKIRTSEKLKLLEMLSYGELDGLFINGEYNHSQFEAVYSYFENITIISLTHDQLKKQHEQTLLVNSDPSCVYRNTLFDFWRKRNDKEPAIIEFDSLEAILQAVSEGLGISLMPDDVAQNRKENTIHFQKLKEKIKIEFLIKQRKQQRHSLKKFIHFLQS
ncbi:LysR family transcriptional regulator [Bacillus gobiensis]|uniref:LysR family transcriptional regulator n=1 Tax=Bacillus gobiensis TaxID=1441095 RepID=UPI003D21284A